MNNMETSTAPSLEKVSSPERALPDISVQDVMENPAVRVKLLAFMRTLENGGDIAAEVYDLVRKIPGAKSPEEKSVLVEKLEDVFTAIGLPVEESSGVLKETSAPETPVSTSVEEGMGTARPMPTFEQPAVAQDTAPEAAPEAASTAEAAPDTAETVAGFDAFEKALKKIDTEAKEKYGDSMAMLKVSGGREYMTALVEAKKLSAQDSDAELNRRLNDMRKAAAALPQKESVASATETPAPEAAQAAESATVDDAAPDAEAASEEAPVTLDTLRKDQPQEKQPKKNAPVEPPIKRLDVNGNEIKEEVPQAPAAEAAPAVAANDNDAPRWGSEGGAAAEPQKDPLNIELPGKETLVVAAAREAATTPEIMPEAIGAALDDALIDPVFADLSTEDKAVLRAAELERLMKELNLNIANDNNPAAPAAVDMSAPAAGGDPYREPIEKAA